MKGRRFRSMGAKVCRGAKEVAEEAAERRGKQREEVVGLTDSLRSHFMLLPKEIVAEKHAKTNTSALLVPALASEWSSLDAN
jgi:hypothetical protein